MGPDGGVVLIDPVIVREHRGASDIRILADGGVAHIRQVRNLRATADGGIFGLDVGPDLPLVAQVSSGAQVRERPDVGVAANGGVRTVRANNLRSRTNGDIGEGGIGPDLRVVFNVRCAVKLGPRMNGDITSDRDIDINPRGFGIDDGGPIAHVFFANVPVEHPSGGGKLDAIIHTGQFRGIMRHVPAGNEPLVSGNAKDIRQVHLALGVIGVQLAQ